PGRGIGPGAEQAVGDLEVVLADGPMQRGRAVRFERDHVRLLPRELERRGAVAGLEGSDERRLCRGDACGEEGGQTDARGGAHAQSSVTVPVLSPSVSSGTSALCSIVSSRFV